MPLFRLRFRKALDVLRESSVHERHTAQCGLSKYPMLQSVLLLKYDLV